MWIHDLDVHGLQELLQQEQQPEEEELVVELAMALSTPSFVGAGSWADAFDLWLWPLQPPNEKYQRVRRFSRAQHVIVVGSDLWPLSAKSWLSDDRLMENGYDDATPVHPTAAWGYY